MASLVEYANLSAMRESLAKNTEIGSKGKSRGVALVVAFFLGLSFLIAVGFTCFYFFVAKPMKESAMEPVARLADAMSNILGTTVEVQGKSVVLEQSEIGELALLQRKMHSITKYQGRWLGSEKTLIVRCDFIVKAGFDLSEGGQWGFLHGELEGALPEGKVLSVEPLGDFEIYFSESGILNKLSSEDHAEAFNLLKDQARRDAEESDIVEEVERNFRIRIMDKIGGEEVIP